MSLRIETERRHQRAARTTTAAALVARADRGDHRPAAIDTTTTETRT